MARCFHMELVVSFLQPPAKYILQSGMKSAVAFEAEGGHPNSLRRRMRFNPVLVSRISRLCCRSKHKLANQLTDDADSYGAASISNQPKFIDKVSVMLGYSHLDGFVNRTRREDGLVPGSVDNFDASAICKKFPSITLGSSSEVELFNESLWDHQITEYSSAVSCNDSQLNLSDCEWIAPEKLTESCSSHDPGVLNVISPTVSEKVSWNSSFDKYPAAQHVRVSAPEEPFASMVLEHNTLVELFLDKPICCIEGLSTKHRRQLEDCEFHTLRKLLHHFPRTYADLRNCHMGIEDGQYFIFVGKVLSSRAIKAGCSLSILEVIVCGEVGDGLTTAEVDPAHISTEQKKIIYLHLKKFLRGVRFTSQGFLKVLEKKHKEGDIVCASGKVKTTSKKDHYEMREYSLDLIENDDSCIPVKARPYPIYSSKGGAKPQLLRDVIARVLQSLPPNIDPIPQDITKDNGLLELHDAYNAIHQPPDLDIANVARRRFIFDEFFYLQLGRLYQMLEGLGSRIEKEGLLDRYKNIDQSSIFSEDWSDLTKSFLNALHFSLTKSQLTAVSDIILDLKRPVPMNRLLQGDVGCGKTVVAFLACMEVIGCGYQAAYMVPTELLAIQHYNDLVCFLENVESDRRPSVALLTGSTATKQARMIRHELQAGTISLVIGTHSLIAEKVGFSALRLAVIDEQHRFGVIQRGTFNSKLWYASGTSGVGEAVCDTPKAEVQMAPHVLAMSATPIPRSLALALYGDMSLTQITDLPPGRLPIETKIIVGDQNGFENVYELNMVASFTLSALSRGRHASCLSPLHRFLQEPLRRHLRNMMLLELQAGGKVYIVYPIIEQSEQLPQLRAASGDYDAMCSRFSSFSCGLLHGRMKGDEKEKALKQFRDGETQILLATQVIEIGVDVPDASMMVVMNAERFGIAQLHQLRGRVGRGSEKSKCIFVPSTATSVTRLNVLEHSSDGFHLAKVDLLLRGPGDLLGKKQSGHLPEFPIARLEVDGSIIQDAHVAALKLLSASHNLEKYPLLKAELSMRQPLSLLGD